MTRSAPSPPTTPRSDGTPRVVEATNVTDRPVDRLGIQFPPPANVRRGDGVVERRTYPIRVRYSNPTDELRLRACKALSLRWLEGEPFRPFPTDEDVERAESIRPHVVPAPAEPAPEPHAAPLRFDDEEAARLAAPGITDRTALARALGVELAGERRAGVIEALEARLEEMEEE